MESLYNAVNGVLQLPSVILDGVDYAPLITSITTGLICIVVLLNLFALIRVIFNR